MPLGLGLCFGECRWIFKTMRVELFTISVFRLRRMQAVLTGMLSESFRVSGNELFVIQLL